MTIELNKGFQWNQNWVNKLAHTDINLVVQELKVIEEIHGEITPNLLLESAKNKKSVLHDYFDWDNDAAANKWRLRQASKLLGNIEVRVIQDNEPKIIRAFVKGSISAFDENKYSYKSISLSDETQKKNAQTVALMNLRSVVKRISIYPEYKKASVFINKAIEELSKESTEPKDANKPALVAVS